MADLIRPSSGDIVTNAGAGGEFVRRLMESARAKRASNTEPKGGAMTLDELKAKMAESAKKLREAGTDEERTKALDELDALGKTDVEQAEPTLEGLTEDKLKESQPTLYQKIRESAKAEVTPVTPQGGTPDEKDAKIATLEGKLVESEQKAKETGEKLRESEKTTTQTNAALLGIKVLREAKVPAEEAEEYLSRFRESGVSDEAGMKAVLARDKAREERTLARIRESFGLDFVEGMPGRTDDGEGLIDLSDEGVPKAEPEPAAAAA
jgi:hypothetical protein